MPVEIFHAPLDPATMGPASRYVRETRDAMLAYEIAELAALRFSMLLTARWEASDGESAEQRAELRSDLALLHRYYGDKIDDIAMTFGVKEAMNAKDDVERTVVVPGEMKPIVIQPKEKVGRQESGETGYGI